MDGNKGMRMLACIAALAAMVIGSLITAPAYAAETAEGILSVDVPTQIPCTLLPDGTVMVPTGLAIENNSSESLVADVHTADDKGHRVDFTLDIGGARALTRSDGKDAAGARGVDVGTGETAMSLKVSKLNRQSDAALMDAAANGAVDMFKLGFKFTEKNLLGNVSVSGGATVGSTLTAIASGMQSDAVPRYQWYRDGVEIGGAVDGTYRTSDDDAGHDITCKVTDTSGRYTGTLTSNLIRPTKSAEAFAVFSADDESLSFYKRTEVPKVGSRFEGKTVTGVYTGIEESVYTTDAPSPWNDVCTRIQKVVAVDEIQPVATSRWFYGFSNLDAAGDIDLSKLNTSKTIYMDYMFQGCVNLSSLDVSGFDTSNVTSMIGMFRDCAGLTLLNLSNFDTSKVINMEKMFLNCRMLRLVRLGGKFAWAGTDSCLPSPDDAFIPGADGKWYNTSAVGFPSSGISSNKADTYTAIPPFPHEVLDGFVISSNITPSPDYTVDWQSPVVPVMESDGNWYYRGVAHMKGGRNGIAVPSNGRCAFILTVMTGHWFDDYDLGNLDIEVDSVLSGSGTSYTLIGDVSHLSGSMLYEYFGGLNTVGMYLGNDVVFSVVIRSK